jgi:hypothetical protein
MDSRYCERLARENAEMRQLFVSLGLSPKTIERAMKIRMKRSVIQRPDRLGKKGGRPPKE